MIFLSFKLFKFHIQKNIFMLIARGGLANPNFVTKSQRFPHSSQRVSASLFPYK